MRGKITGISGPSVTIDLKDVQLYERVYIGHAMLTGEVVRVNRDHAIVQVFEDTRGLAAGEPAEGTGRPFTLELGPGLLSIIFDGLQRPLLRLHEKAGPFIRSAINVPRLEHEKKWIFHPSKKKGESAEHGDLIGYIEEGGFRHTIFCGPEAGGTISFIQNGEVTIDTPIAEFENGTKVYGHIEWPLRMPRPFRKKLPPDKPLVTGQRSIDFLFTIAKGGTAIIPGGFGTGKTILEHSIAKFADVDIVVYAGCGERGNEMAELIEEFAELKDPRTGRRLMDKTIMVVNTSNMPVAAREASIYTAVTIAEYYRDMGLHVLLLADSISRWAEALREISASLEELPGEEGYPTYLASRLAGFFERSGTVETLNGDIGSLSMIISVSPPGADFTEPVTQACLRTAGAFLMLDTGLAHRRHFPAINWSQSYSLYTGRLLEYFKTGISREWEDAQIRCREILHKEEKLREVAEIVGPEGLQDMDRLIMHTAELIRTEFLSQNAYTGDAFSTPEQTLKKIKAITGFYDDADKQLGEGIKLDEVLK